MSYEKIPMLENGQPDWENIPDERLRQVVITLDGRGIEFKTKALDELLSRARSEGLDIGREMATGHIG